LYSALSSKIEDNSLIIVDSLDGKNGKTREALSLLENLNALDSTLIVCDDKNNLIYRGVKNLQNVSIIDVSHVNVYDLLRYRNLIISKEDINKLMEVLS